MWCECRRESCDKVLALKMTWEVLLSTCAGLWKGRAFPANLLMEMEIVPFGGNWKEVDAWYRVVNSLPELCTWHGTLWTGKVLCKEREASKPNVECGTWLLLAGHWKPWEKIRNCFFQRETKQGTGMFSVDHIVKNEAVSSGADSKCEAIKPILVWRQCGGQNSCCSTRPMEDRFKRHVGDLCGCPGGSQGWDPRGRVTSELHSSMPAKRSLLWLRLSHLLFRPPSLRPHMAPRAGFLCLLSVPGGREHKQRRMLPLQENPRSPQRLR